MEKQTFQGSVLTVWGMPVTRGHVGHSLVSDFCHSETTTSEIILLKTGTDDMGMRPILYTEKFLPLHTRTYLKIEGGSRSAIKGG